MPVAFESPAKALSVSRHSILSVGAAIENTVASIVSNAHTRAKPVFSLGGLCPRVLMYTIGSRAIASVHEYLWSILGNRKRLRRLRVRVERRKDRRVLAEMLLQRIDAMLIVRMI